MNLKVLLVLSLFSSLCACGKQQDDESDSTSNKSFIKPNIENTQPSSNGTQISDQEKNLFSNQAETVMNHQGTTAYQLGAVDQNMTPFPPTQNPPDLKRIIFTSAGVGGLIALFFQQMYRYRNPMEFKFMPVIKSAAGSFAVGGVCAAGLVFLALTNNAPAKPQVVYNFNYVIPNSTTSLSNNLALLRKILPIDENKKQK